MLTPMTPADLPAMLAIERASFPKPWTAAMLLQELDLPFSRILVCRDGGDVYGYLCRWVVADEVQILNVAVAPAARRRGVASTLMDAVCREARALGLAALTLEVRRGNAGARAFYAARGFREVGVRPGYYARDEDALIMRRELADG